ncbi:MAG: response regulator [Phenylobacterium sp.]|uniref:response regulator n=1 Tax=Phenylobacterium sp. TaxID=1871053 RepID=UPI0011F618D9|nr:response regulator [Phenylobacterium sp.]TAJ73663.1 MAG: response regulator [Phenylobacterium sp.]
MQFDGRASKIMVVDHDRTTLEMMHLRLDVAGFHPMSARSGRAALEVLETSRPDALILERNLPEMCGLELLRAIAAMPGRPVPVLLVGRNLAAEDVRMGMQFGVRDCLAKPFSGAAVLERLNRMLKRSAASPAAARPVVHLNA